VVGHSQGGHAALGAGSLAFEHPSLMLVGIVGLAPASQILTQGESSAALITNSEVPIEARISAAVGRLSFSALFMHGTQAVFPAFDPDVAYGKNGSALRAQAEKECLTSILKSLNSTVPDLLIAEGTVDTIIVPDTTVFPEVADYFAIMEPGSRAILAPVMIAQGSVDTTVLAASTDALVAQLSAVDDKDIDPELMSYEGVDHLGVLRASSVDVLSWLAVRFASTK